MKWRNLIEESILAYDTFQVKDFLFEIELHKALKGKSTPSSNNDVENSSKSGENWKDLNLKAISTMRL